MNRNTRNARPARGARALALACTTAWLAAALAGAAPARADLTGTVNVNTATAEELQLLPGIGERKAQAVIAARKQRGGFKALEELMEVKGIGEAALAKLRPYASVQGKTTARRE